MAAMKPNRRWADGSSWRGLRCIPIEGGGRLVVELIATMRPPRWGGTGGVAG